MQSQFDKTFHFIGNTRYDSCDTATGEIYVLAHHLKDGQVRVDVNRHQDSYSRQNREWRLDNRTITID